MARTERYLLGRLRKIALALPEATERVSHGEPAWFAGTARQFMSFANNHHHDGRVAIWIAAPLGVQEALIEDDPARFFRPPYVGPRGWVGVRFDLPEDPDWIEVAELIEDAYRLVAPRKLVAALDARA